MSDVSEKIFENNEIQITEGFKDLFKIYKSKKQKLLNNYFIQQEIDKFWDLMKKDFEGEIDKQNYFLLFSKIYRLLLPKFNHDEITTYLENDWIINCKDKQKLNKTQFSKALFKLIHLWCVHINIDEYTDFLRCVYSRITKIVKFKFDGTQVIYEPNIKIKIHQVQNFEDYESSTWEVNQSEEEKDNGFDYDEETNEDNNTIKTKRPKLDDRFIPIVSSIIYSEETFFDESYSKCDLGETYRRVLLKDEEIVIYGFPTQYILTYFKNNIDELKRVENFKKGYPFKIRTTGFLIEFNDLQNLIETMRESKQIVLRRDFFIINSEKQIGRDFLEEELNIFNNYQRNFEFDRKLTFQQIMTQKSSQITINVDSMIIDPKDKKALECVIEGDQIGISSELWNEKIEEKIEKIVRTKFSILYKKMRHLLNFYDELRSLIEILREEADLKEDEDLTAVNDPENYFFRYLRSTNGIEFDQWNSDEDLLQQARKKSPVVLLIGPPKIGKSTVCAKLAQELNLVLLDPKSFLDNIFEIVKKFEEDLSQFEPPVDDPENPIPEDQKPKAPMLSNYLTPLELRVYTDLTEGRAISEADYGEILKFISKSDLAYSRGILIDQQSWSQISFIDNLIDGVYGSISVDYVVELNMSDDELNYRISTMKHNLKTLEICTSRDLELIRKEKKKEKVEFDDDEPDENDQQDQEEEEVKEEEVKDEDLPEEKQAILPKIDELLPITDLDLTHYQELKFYRNSILPKIKEIQEKLGNNYYKKIDVTGFDADEVVDIIKSRLDFVSPPRPLAKLMEGVSDYKELLTSERNGLVPPRRWSYWKQTDPVALVDDFKILPGILEFPAEFFGRVFLFANEINRKKFLDNPNKYLKNRPEVPKKYRIGIFGPPKSGKKTVAAILNSLYGFKLVNLEEITQAIVDFQKKFDEPNFNNCYTSKIHFSQEEFKEMTVKKKPIDFYSKIVFMLDYLGYPLDRKKTVEEFKEERKYHEAKLHHLLNPPVTEQEQENEEEVNENQENPEITVENPENTQENMGEPLQKKESLNQGQKPIEKRLSITEPIKTGESHNKNLSNDLSKVGSRQSNNPSKLTNENNAPEYVDPFPPEEEYVFEDIKSTQFYLAYNEDCTYPRPGGFIVLSHPANEEEINKFKDFKIEFDKIIYLSDQSDTPLKSLFLRSNPHLEGADDEKLEPEIAKLKEQKDKIDETITILKEKLGEDNIIELNCMEKIEDLKLKLKMIIDPFYTRVDPDDRVIASSDINEEQIPVPKGEYGDFCPVTLKDENWLFYANKEFEVQVNHKKYIFAGENEKNKFSVDPSLYLNSNLTPIDVVKNCPPHIFIAGYQGCGISTLTNLLSKEYKMSKKDLRSEFLEIWNRERLERKSVRIEKKRLEIEAQRQELIKENPEAANDPANQNDDWMKDEALDEEDPEFKSADNDKRIFKSLFNPLTPTVYDANWFGLDPRIETTFLDFISENRRTPLVFIIVKAAMNTLYKRHINFDEIEEEHKNLLEKAREKKEEQVQQYIKEQNEKEEPVDNDEIARIREAEDDVPKLEDMKDKAKENITQRYGENKTFFHDFKAALKEKNIPIIRVKNNFNVENTVKTIVSELTPFVKQRKNLIEKQLVHSSLSYVNERKLRDLEASGVFRMSANQNFSPINPHKMIKKTNFPVIYRDKIYYFNSLEEKEQFCTEPLNYRTGNEFPIDINTRKLVFVIGNLKSGKSTISKMLEDRGFKRVTLKDSIYDLFERTKKNFRLLHDCLLRSEIENCLKNGIELEDELVVKIIMKRIDHKDFSDKNIVFDGFPFTLKQADLLSKNSVIPDFVLHCDLPEDVLIQRASKIGKFKKHPFILNERFHNYKVQLIDILKFYTTKEYTIRYVDTLKSNWLNREQILELFEEKIKCERNFSANLFKNKPSPVSKILTQKHSNLLKKKIPPINMYSPVSLKIKNEFHFNKHNLNNIIYFNCRYYFLSNETEEPEFIKNLHLYNNYFNEIQYDLKVPRVFGYEKIETMLEEKHPIEYQKCCPVSILNDKSMKPGSHLYFVEFRDKAYIFENAAKMWQFTKSPLKFNNIPFNVKIVEQAPSSVQKVNFELTKSYLETNFGSIITKGLLELSRNKIKYPQLSTKETTIKYLSLYLKANNPSNNDYSRFKYTSKLEEFLKDSKLPFDLLNVYNKHEKNKNDVLQKELIRKQLNKLANEYDELMEKAKNYKNTRFADFFKKN